MKKPKGPKAVSYELISENSIAGGPMYVMLQGLIRAEHKDLDEARIALAWCTSWKPDVDGRVTLGKCKKSTDLDREVHEFDFIILLQKDFWTNGAVKDEQRRALLDHELCHAAVSYDKDSGEVVYDERGRIVYRIRKHDIEEFAQIVERHGTWKRDLEKFAQALLRSKQGDLQLPPDNADKKTPRIVPPSATH